MLGALLNHKLDPILYRIAKAIRGLINPNYLTFIGFLINGGAAVLLALGLWKVAGAAVLLGGLFDMLDGAVARAQGRVTAFGAFFDSVMDRYSDSVLLMGIIFFYAYSSRPSLVMLATVATIGSLLVPFARARAETVIPSCKVGIMERPERVILIAAGAVFDWMVPVLWILTVLTHVTVIQRILYTRQKLRTAAPASGPPPRASEPTLSQEDER